MHSTLITTVRYRELTLPMTIADHHAIPIESICLRSPSSGDPAATACSFHDTGACIRGGEKAEPKAEYEECDKDVPEWRILTEKHEEEEAER
jgi:hypothetical protein